MTNLTDAKLEEIEGRAGKATAGPWELGDGANEVWNERGMNYLGDVSLGRIDAEFISAAREDVPALIAEVKRLRSAFQQIADDFDNEDMDDDQYVAKVLDISKDALNGEA